MHKLRKKQFNLDGPNEVAMLCDRILNMVQPGDPEDPNKPKAIFQRYYI